MSERQLKLGDVIVYSIPTRTWYGVVVEIKTQQHSNKKALVRWTDFDTTYETDILAITYSYIGNLFESEFEKQTLINCLKSGCNIPGEFDVSYLKDTLRD